MEFQKALKVVTDGIKNDPDLYITYQIDIARAFTDEFHRIAGEPGEMVFVNSDELHEIADQAAKNFLNLLCEIKNPESCDSG